MNQEEKLTLIKDILLTDEREIISNIQHKITVLEKTVNKQDLLSDKVSLSSNT